MNNSTRIAIINYKAGNITSVKNSLKKIDYSPKIITNGKDLIKYNPSHIILPGVGAIGKTLETLKKLDFIEALEISVTKNNSLFLGICVGMQILANECIEFGNHKGLGWIPGTVRKINNKKTFLKVPHVGWNSLNVIKKENSIIDLNKKIDAYFLHSCIYDCDKKYIIAESFYGKHFPSVIGHKNIFGVQFHPEKSASLGLALLRNFLCIKKG